MDVYRDHETYDVETAVQNLGLNNIHHMLMGLLARQFVLHDLKTYQITGEDLWKATVANATCAELMAEILGSNRSIAFLSGILQPVGFIVLDIIAQRHGIEPKKPEERTLAWEEKHFFTNNANASGHIIKVWGLAKQIPLVVQNRYRLPNSATIKNQISTLHLGCCLAEKIGFGMPFEKGLYLTPQRILEANGITNQTCERIAEQALNRIQEIQDTFAHPNPTSERIA